MTNKEIVNDITQLTEEILNKQPPNRVSHDMRLKAMEIAGNIVMQRMQNEKLHLIANSLPF